MHHRVGELTRLNLQMARQLARARAALTQSRHQANHDPLTGLPNRGLLLDRLEQAFLRARRTGHQVALLLLDLNDFKQVNDRFGHAAGDEVLRQAGTRLTGCIRAGDTVSRYGGDEFVVVLPDIEARATQPVARGIARRALAMLARPYTIDRGTFSVTASAGMAVYSDPRQSSDDLIQRADAAMYHAKCAPRLRLRLAVDNARH